jgi:hypothetical protein
MAVTLRAMRAPQHGEKSRLYNLGLQGIQAALPGLPPDICRGIVAPASALMPKFQMAD